MPPKIDVATLIEKSDSTIGSFYDILAEFNVRFEVQPVRKMFTKKWKHRSHKRQQETITDKLCEARTEGSGKRLIDSSVKSSKLIF